MTTSADRIMAAFTFKEADRPPVSPLVCGAARRVYGASYDEWSLDADINAKSVTQAQKLIGFDVIVTLIDLSLEAADLGQEVVYPENDTAHPNYDNPYVSSPSEYEKIVNAKPIDVTDPKSAPRMNMHIETCKKLVDWNPEVPVCPFVYGPMGILSMMRGAEHLFLECLTHKKEVMAAMGAINKILLDYLKVLCELNVPAIVFDCLYGSQTIMSQKMWEDIEAPFAKELADATRAAGKLVLMHNCGNGPYIGLQDKWMGLAGYSFADLPPDCSTPEELKNTYGKKMVLHGHVMPSPTLFLGTPEEVKEECKRQMTIYAHGGGYILGASCEYPPNGSVLNAIAMVEAANEWSYT